MLHRNNTEVALANLDTIPHGPQNSLALLHIVIVVDSQPIRLEEGLKVVETSILGCSIGASNVRFIAA